MWLVYHSQHSTILFSQVIIQVSGLLVPVLKEIPRSHSPTKPSTWNTSLPVDVDVSKISFTDSRATLASFSRPFRSSSNFSLRASQSSLETTTFVKKLSSASASMGFQRKVDGIFGILCGKKPILLRFSDTSVPLGVPLGIIHLACPR